ncbi:hypothetical protein NFJ02_08g139030 [Pycnococcus provasolii]
MPQHPERQMKEVPCSWEIAAAQATRVPFERTPPPPEVPPNDDERRSNARRTDNAGHASEAATPPPTAKTIEA